MLPYLFLFTYIVVSKTKNCRHNFINEALLILIYSSFSFANLTMVIISILLFIQSLFDLWYEESYSIIHYLILFIGMLSPYKVSIIEILIGINLPLLLILINRIYKQVIGDGDIELLFCTVLILGIESYYAFYLAYLLLAFYLIIPFVQKNKLTRIPFIPFLSIAILIVINTF